MASVENYLLLLTISRFFWELMYMVLVVQSSPTLCEPHEL